MAPQRQQQTVAELLGAPAPFEFDASPLRNVQPENIWANYDYYVCTLGT